MGMTGNLIGKSLPQLRSGQIDWIECMGLISGDRWRVQGTAGAVEECHMSGAAADNQNVHEAFKKVLSHCGRS